MKMTTNKDRLEGAHDLIARSAGQVALILASRRGLNTTALQRINEDLRTSIGILETIIRSVEK
jgi:hypothetical protein